jgi:two-component system response regulator
MVREGEEIVLVEDNPDDVVLTKRALRKNGLECRVVVVGDGEEALRHLLDPGGHEVERLVLVDLRLPKVDGLEVLRRLRAERRTKDLPVALLVCSKERGVVAAQEGALADLQLEKAVDFELFVREVGRLRTLLRARDVTREESRKVGPCDSGPASAGPGTARSR